jgi:hypothetical protein
MMLASGSMAHPPAHPLDPAVGSTCVPSGTQTWPWSERMGQVPSGQQPVWQARGALTYTSGHVFVGQTLGSGTKNTSSLKVGGGRTTHTLGGGTTTIGGMRHGHGRGRQNG